MRTIPLSAIRYFVNITLDMADDAQVEIVATSRGIKFRLAGNLLYGDEPSATIIRELEAFTPKPAPKKEVQDHD